MLGITAVDINVQRFVQARPKVCCNLRGKHNSYGHPHPKVLANLQDHQVQIYDTAQDKAVRVSLGRHKPAWSMAMQARFWREP